MKVTRILYSQDLNQEKYLELEEQARRLGLVRSLVWERYGSLAGVGVFDSEIRNRWMKDGTAAEFGVLANPWKETVRDAVGDIRANRAAAKALVKQAINKKTKDNEERRRLRSLLKRDRWIEDPWLHRQMRKAWKRGHNHTNNQIVVRADAHYNTKPGWISVPGLEPRKLVRIPLSSNVAPEGTLRLILRAGRVEVHYTVDVDQSESRPCGTEIGGVDKGYTEVFVDSAGNHHGEGFGALLTAESDARKLKYQRRAKIAAVAAKSGSKKRRRIEKNNLGRKKADRRLALSQAKQKTLVYTATNQVYDKIGHLAAEDLTKQIRSKAEMGRNANRRLSGWTKGLISQALKDVSGRRGSTLEHVNAAYTSQTCPDCEVLADRTGNRLVCIQCGVVWQADHAGALNVLGRLGDPDIHLWTPHWRVKQIIQGRQGQRSRLPDQDSSCDSVNGERTIQSDVEGVSNNVQ